MEVNPQNIVTGDYIVYNKRVAVVGSVDEQGGVLACRRLDEDCWCVEVAIRQAQLMFHYLKDGSIDPLYEVNKKAARLIDEGLRVMGDTSH